MLFRDGGSANPTRDESPAASMTSEMRSTDPLARFGANGKSARPSSATLR
jgi:hypothetical protein